MYGEVIVITILLRIMRETEMQRVGEIQRGTDDVSD